MEFTLFTLAEKRKIGKCMGKTVVLLYTICVIGRRIIMSVLDQTKAHQRFFEAMTKIPHGSFHEKAYSDYLVAFAKDHGYEYVQDAMNNVIIYAPASLGYEAHETVILQAHMDMVCEKNKDVEFDFAKDALKLCVQEGWLSAQGTTLGADDGVGDAYMLAILDGDYPHPPLECVFTVQEEVGLYGALGLDASLIHGKRLINLDDGGETCTCTTSAGGVNVIAECSVNWKLSTDAAYQLSVTGLSGGHSGGEIHKEKGNANKLMARILYAIGAKGDIALASIEGGLKDNAIPREAFCTFTTDLPQTELTQIVQKMEQDMKKELEFSDAGVKITLTNAQAEHVMEASQTRNYIRLMRLLPNGMRHHSMSIEGLTTASINAAVVTCEDGKLAINCSIRGALESFIDTIAEEVEILADTYGFKTHREARYPAWSYDAKSDMRETLQRVFKNIYGKELELIAVHGGLECGIFKAMDADMDIVTMGPVMEDIHTPNERLDLASFDRTFALLCAFLKEL